MSRTVLNQFEGVGGAIKTHQTSIHALVNIVRNEGLFAVYNG